MGTRRETGEGHAYEDDSKEDGGVSAMIYLVIFLIQEMEEH